MKFSCGVLYAWILEMDFVFDRIASGRAIKCLVIIDNATHEAIAVAPEHSIGGDHLVRILDRICAHRGKPLIIRTDNGKEFTGRALLTWAHRNGLPCGRSNPASPPRTHTSNHSTADCVTSA
jgi:transposase InsO family protein